MVNAETVIITTDCVCMGSLSLNAVAEMHIAQRQREESNGDCNE